MSTRLLSSAANPRDLVQVYVTGKAVQLMLQLKSFERYALYKLHRSTGGKPVHGMKVTDSEGKHIIFGAGNHEHTLTTPGRYVLAYDEKHCPTDRDTRLSHISATKLNTACGCDNG